MVESLIVGAHFRPPAKVLLTELPLNFPLVLHQEPENEYSKTGKAVKVLLPTAGLPESFWEKVEPQLERFGSSRENLELATPVHVGYVAEKNSEDIQEEIFNLLDGPVTCHFSRNMTGAAIVVVEEAEASYDAGGDE